eukprot:TRINITY_DN4372_c0_g1_i3.p1 TRINITY_DN4372_c0_g1~~TRINITY_DN4372_c0_g1_i3.p1  ORF type:complete len:129 (+),score=5.53 TRINITY_DN4372_c0_g1_i3:65-451(+)
MEVWSWSHSFKLLIFIYLCGTMCSPTVKIFSSIASYHNLQAMTMNSSDPTGLFVVDSDTASTGVSTIHFVPFATPNSTSVICTLPTKDVRGMAIVNNSIYVSDYNSLKLFQITVPGPIIRQLPITGIT